MLFAVGLFVAWALFPTAAQAQRKGKDKGKGSAPAMGPTGPSPDQMKKMMQGMQHGMGSNAMHGMGSMPGTRSKTPKKPAQKREKDAAENLDTEKLPDHYHVPPIPPDALTTTEEWIEEPFIGADKKELDRSQRVMLGKYKAILSAGDFANNDEKETVRKIVLWRLARLTRKDERENAIKRRIEIEQDIKNTPGNTKSGPRTVRKFILKTIAEEAPKLFEYHFIARLNGAILLAELSGPEFNEEEATQRAPAKPFVLAAEPLLRMVEDQNQLAAVRTWGVNGLVRLAVLPELSAAKRNEIVETLVKQMNASGKEHEWYQWRLAEGLGRLSVIQDASKAPVVPQALAMVLADKERPWLVRAEAAQSLGRLPYDRDIDLGLVAYETAQLALQMTDEFQKEPKLSSWKIYFIKLYGAFKPIDEEDEKKKLGLLKQVEQKPALSSYKRTVQETFELVLPLVTKVVNNPAGIDAPLSNLKKWLEANPPKNTSLQNGLEPIVKQVNPAAEQHEPAGS